MIELDGVSKVYQTADGPVCALDAVDLEVPPGQYTAIRGPSGCGKSTLLTIVGALAAPSGGKVHVARQDIGSLSPAAKARIAWKDRARQVRNFFLTTVITAPSA